jgi:Mitochondrial carrier protein
MSDHAAHSEECSNGGSRKNHLTEDPSSLLRRFDTTTAATAASGSAMLCRRPTFQRPISEPVHSASLICGLLAGVAQAGVFNPYDRALYLSVKHNRPFLHRHNWYNPYTGFAQSIGGRALQGGLYFPAEHFFLRCINSDYETVPSDPKLNFLAGTAAGAFNATVLNPISAIKYKTWGRDVNRGMMQEIFGMLRKAGSIRPFFNGLYPTVVRDVVFGGTYTWLRLQIPLWYDLPPTQHWIGNLVAAGLATVMSGPFNYVRNIQFGTPSHEKAASMFSVLRDLAVEASAQPRVLGKIAFLQTKLRIGWGTARVAMGMTFAHSVYDYLHENLVPQLRT